MFKRANKITALLVAAASVMSIVPAMAADSTRLGTKDGTIESAVAFDGKYIYEGFKGDESKAVWFNDGSKDKELTDFEDYDFTDGDDGIYAYGEKYILAQDNDDYYLTDLTSGAITDDTLEDKLDSTASKLEKALSKTDKYDGTTVVAKDLNGVAASASFQEPWYYVNKTNDGVPTRIFTDVNGKYVDSSVLANIYAYSSKRQEVVKIDKYETDYKDTGLRVDLVKQPEVIAQDKDNLYAIVNVNITDNNQLSTAVAGKGQAEVDFSKAATGNTQQVSTTGSPETIVVNTAAFSTTNSAVTVNGVTHNYVAGTYVGANLLNDLANTTITGYTKSISGNVVTFTGTTNEDKTNAATAVAGFVTVTNGAADVYTSQPAKFKVAGKTYEYSATIDDSTHYTSLATLKNQIIKDNSGTILGNTYTFNPTTFVFTATATGTTAADITDDLGAVKNVVAGTTAGTTPTGKVTNAWYLQKISKAQGSTDEEASIPKEVKSYQLDNKSLYDNGDVKDATDWLITDGSINKFVNVEVKDNSLYAYKLSDSDTVKVLKLDLKQIKENPVDKTVFGDSKLDGYVVKKDGDTDQDFDDLSVDVNGILWVLHDGKIIKFAEKDKTTTYTCDSGLDQLSVYDGKNLIAWSEDDERYTTVTEGTAVTAGEATAVAPVIVTGWVAGTDGTWTFNDATGAKVVSKWVNVGGAWYFLKADGIMATGWYNDNGTWYYLKSSGAMATGWVNDGNAWYYLNASGAMLSNTTVDGYVLNASGAWVK